jgi:predicted metal-dependent hydrolase
LLHHRYRDVTVPVRVYFENRPNVRVSIGQQNVLLRIPAGISSGQVEKHLDWAGQWIDRQLKKNPLLLERFLEKDYSNGQLFRINGEEFRLHFSEEDRKSFSVRQMGQSLLIKVPAGLPTRERGQGIRLTLSRFFSSLYLDQVTARIEELNERFFNEDIQSIRIKYNRSNWGSCSAKRNINISSRLLFAPPKVQDYVFVHELAHLKVLDHSPRFWRLVGNIMPDYKAKEKWLRENSHRLDF